jgi:parallel beta-helix repeat protein
LAALTCAALGTLTGIGMGPLVTHISSPSTGWASPTRYTVQSDNLLPPRNRVRMVPDQFAAVTALKHLIGTSVTNLVVRPDRVEMMVGDATIWSGFYRSLAGFTGRVTLPALATLVAKSPHPDWLRQTDLGVYQLAAGMVQSPGSRLEVAGPEVKELRLVFQPYVYMSGVGASVLFQDVRVTSWVPASGGPAPSPFDRRPFISYNAGGRLDIVNSEFSYLGADASKAYGVSWGTGTTGQAIGSTFHHNLFGAYTGGAVGVTFRNNVFRNNARYGLDPHTGSVGLLIVGNEAYGNNTHGIIFSKSVNHSIVEGNRSHDNGANGIMMDEKSDFNTIRNNQSWNNGFDGIVIQGSSHDVVSGNKVSGNTIGVRIDSNKLGVADGTRVVNNDISGNRHGVQVYGGAQNTETMGNQITDTADQALHFTDPAVSQSDTVSGALKAVVVDHFATIRGLVTSNVGRAVVVNRGAQASVEYSQLTGKDIAVEVAPQSHLRLLGTNGGALSTISSARKAMVVSGTADLRNVVIQNVDRGVLVDPDGHATIATSSIVTASKGVEVAGFNGQSRVQLVDSDIRAPKPLVGSTLWQASGNTLSSIPSWLAVAGALFVALAALLHLGHRLFAPASDVRHKSRPALEAAPTS